MEIEKVIGKEHEERRFLAFVEDWEQRCLEKKDASSQILLKRKYGKIKLCDTDEGGLQPHVIDNLTVEWHGGKDMKCWCVQVRKDVTVTDENKDCYVPWKINSDLHFAIRSFYRRNPGE